MSAISIILGRPGAKVRKQKQRASAAPNDDAGMAQADTVAGGVAASPKPMKQQPVASPGAGRRRKSKQRSHKRGGQGEAPEAAALPLPLRLLAGVGKLQKGPGRKMNLRAEEALASLVAGLKGLSGPPKEKGAAVAAASGEDSSDGMAADDEGEL